MAEDSFIRLYPQYKPTDSRRKDSPAYNNLRSYSGRVDSKIQTDVYKVQESFKEFLKPINGVKQEVDRLDLSIKHNAKHMVFSALSPIVPIRRISSVPDNIEDGNYERAAGLIALAAVNLPEDTRDLKAAAKQIFKGELPKYDYKNFQAPFSFFRGTVLEPIVNKMGKVGVWLYSQDKSLYYTKFGKFINKIFKSDISEMIKTEREVPQVIKNDLGEIVIKSVQVKAYKLEGKALSRLINRALLRIPVISIFVLGALELPSIIKSVNKPDNTKDKAINGTAQILKSGINVASILSGIGIVGTFLARKGPAGSLVGMGLGSVAGVYISKFASSKIDDLKEQIKI